MANSVENVYGTALFELCDEQGTLDGTYQELTEVSNILSDPAQAEFMEMLSSPLIPFEDKQKVLSQVFTGRLSDTALDFLCVVTQKGRIRDLPAIAQQFKQMYYDKKNILEVTATTVQPLSESLRKKLVQKLEGVSGKSIILHEKQDKSILGGIVLRYGNTQIDSSVRTKLDKIKAQIDSAIV
ncbi:ATP synthase F1 subunit delta [Ruminococcus sp. FC2018]|uniref:ATP synthase F1 subunit delta n=1 Tax=Ruminococcus sp. FC2018 TaxID=1410617 RepID=UPI00049124D3|nr:ATP synthase F1 subunit delta [Ruminococcus sp. FC2018]